MAPLERSGKASFERSHRGRCTNRSIQEKGQSPPEDIIVLQAWNTISRPGIFRIVLVSSSSRMKHITWFNEISLMRDCFPKMNDCASAISCSCMPDKHVASHCISISMPLMSCSIPMAPIVSLRLIKRLQSPRNICARQGTRKYLSS